MMEKTTLLCVSFLYIVVSIPCIAGVDWDVVTPLDEYVHRDDGYFSWREVASYRFEGVTVHIINMTSQIYQDETFVSQPVWWHIMDVAIPDNLLYLDAGILFISGGNNGPEDPPPDQSDSNLLKTVALANDTGCVAGTIFQVPNQPLVFANDPTQMFRYEDNIIAWTWRTYLDDPTPDKEIILRMPMTKAAKRGLDTIYEVAKQRVPETNIQRFMVAGASKRGWTTWSLAATDRRVVAMAPMVFSLLNVNETAMKHFQNMDGAWSLALSPYYNENLTKEFVNPKANEVWSVEDMYYYRERFTIPILEIVSSGDVFFLPDDNWNWWNDIPGPKYLLMLPNAGHSMVPHFFQIYETGVSFWLTYLEEIPYPTVTWEMSQYEGGGSIVLSTNPPPISVEVYSAVTLGNDTRRDFRLQSLDDDGQIQFHSVGWRQTLTVIDEGDGNYRVDAEVVDGEWVGFYLLATWKGPTGYRMTFTTQVNIIPDTRPHDPCTTPESCWSVLV